MKKKHSLKQTDLKLFLPGAWILVLFVLLMPTPARSQKTIHEMTIEEISGSLNAGYQLTTREQFVLQPILNEIVLYNDARNEIGRQFRFYKNSLEEKLRLMHQCIDHVRNQGFLSMHEENRFGGLVGLLAKSAPGLVEDPDAVEKRAFTRPWGWVSLKDLPDKVKEVQRQNSERLEQWQKGAYLILFNWPEFPWNGTICPRGRLEEFLKTETQKIYDMQGNTVMDAFGIVYPNLDWIYRKRIQENIGVAMERLVKMRDQIRNGTLRMRSEEANLQDRVFLVQPSRSNTDDLHGWVTKEQIGEKITLLENKLAAIRDQYKAKTLRINRKRTGLVSHSDILASMEAIRAKVEEVNKQIDEGKYNVYFPGPKKWYTRASLDEEMKKISERITQIGNSEKYYIPVIGVSLEATRDMMLESLKSKGISQKQKAYIQRKLRQIGATQALEGEYYYWLQHHLSQEHYKFFNASRTFLTSGVNNGLSYINLTSAMPFYYFQKWDFEQRGRFDHEFLLEKRNYEIYYQLKIAYLKKCLAL
jgi:anti-sigma28 factor (negative regulator of flagellin synthesis)